MTLEQLRIFIAVAERQHVTRAAEALNLTQSAVSAAVSALEHRHATKLFHRVGRRIELSEAGLLFLDEARGVLQRAASAELALAELSGLRRGTLSVQASQTIASYWLPRHLVRYRSAYPDIEIALTIGNTAQAAAAVIAGSAELGFVEGDIDESALANEPFAHDELALVVGASHPWAAGAPPDPVDPRATRWVLREPGSGTRSALEHELAERGLALSDLDVLLTLPSNEAVRSAVEAGAGATVMSMASCRPRSRPVASSASRSVCRPASTASCAARSATAAAPRARSSS